MAAIAFSTNWRLFKMDLLRRDYITYHGAFTFFLDITSDFSRPAFGEASEGGPPPPTIKLDRDWLTKYFREPVSGPVAIH